MTGGSTAPVSASYHPGGFCARRLLSLYVRAGGRAPAGEADRMRAVLHLAAYGLRARWRGWAMVVVLIAVAGGAVLSAVAGARRTNSAYPRFLQASNASDVLVSPVGTGLGGYYRALTRLPGVSLSTACRPEHAGAGPGGGASRPPVRASSRQPQGAHRSAAATRPSGRDRRQPERGSRLPAACRQHAGDGRHPQRHTAQSRPMRVSCESG